MKNLFFKNYEHDLEINNLIKLELNRQKNQINLIASENYATISVLKAQGSCLTNKYSEGYPNNRYYEGCKYIDKIENLAIERAKFLFDADYANVQPHSGTQANIAVYNALLKLGDTILSMKLTHGGHLTHGSKVNISGKLYNFIHYEVDFNGEINYNQLEYLAKKYNPKMIVAGSSSYSNIIKWDLIYKISKKINCYFMADISHVSGLISAKLYPNPIYYANVVTSTTHKTLGGPRGGIILSKNQDENFYKKINLSVFPGTQGGPLMNVIAAKAICFKEAMTNEFKKFQKKIILNLKIMGKIFIKRKLKLVSNNLNSNLLLIDLSDKNISGNKISNILSSSNIIVNKNYIPNDKLGGKYTSGIRIGTSSVSRRKINKIYIKKISNWICDIIENPYNKINIKNIKKNIVNICKKFPIY